MKCKKVDCRRGLSEGEVPPSYTFDSSGQLYEIIYEPEDYEAHDKFDGETPETDTYYLEGREEYYGFETICKACGTRFMACTDESTSYNIRNYCPGCGKQLVKAGEPDA